MIGDDDKAMISLKFYENKAWIHPPRIIEKKNYASAEMIISVKTNK